MPSLSTEDQMLLAMLIEELRNEQAPRDREWLLDREIVLTDSVLEVLLATLGIRRVPRFLHWFISFFMNRESRGLIRRYNLVLPFGVEQGFLSCEVIHARDHYLATPDGLAWSQHTYAELGREAAQEQDPMYLAVIICRELENAAQPLLLEDLRQKVLPSSQITESEGPARAAMGAAHDAEIPEVFETGLEKALKLGWIEEDEGNWALTEEGKTGAHFYDDWR